MRSPKRSRLAAGGATETWRQGLQNPGGEPPHLGALSAAARAHVTAPAPHHAPPHAGMMGVFGLHHVRAGTPFGQYLATQQASLAAFQAQQQDTAQVMLAQQRQIEHFQQMLFADGRDVPAPVEGAHAEARDLAAAPAGDIGAHRTGGQADAAPGGAANALFGHLNGHAQQPVSFAGASFDKALVRRHVLSRLRGDPPKVVYDLCEALIDAANAAVEETRREKLAGNEAAPSGWSPRERAEGSSSPLREGAPAVTASDSPSLLCDEVGATDTPRAGESDSFATGGLAARRGFMAPLAPVEYPDGLDQARAGVMQELKRSMPDGGGRADDLPEEYRRAEAAIIATFTSFVNKILKEPGMLDGAAAAATSSAAANVPKSEQP